MNEIHDHKEEFRSSKEFLAAEKGSISSIKETCASLLPAILLVILLSRNQSFQEVNENEYD